MIKRREELKKETILNLKSGDGKIDLINILSIEEMEENGRLFAVNVVPPGCSIGSHLHNGDFETYYIIRGMAEVNDCGHICEVNPGDVVICKNGSFHGIRNIGEEDLEYIALILYSKKETDASAVSEGEAATE